MYRLAAPGALPELLREIVAVGKAAIVADAGFVWLANRAADELRLVVPATDDPRRVRTGDGPVGSCAASRAISNIPDCRELLLAGEIPPLVGEVEARSLLNVPILGQDNSVLGVMQWIGSRPGQFDRHDEWIAPALAAQAAIAIQHSLMTSDLLANAILEQEVSVAREIQVSTLPDSMPSISGYDLHGQFLPTGHTGGDLYDLAILGGRLFLLLGDATGHGFGPALSATQMQAMLRVAFRLGACLDAAYAQVNNQLAEDLPDDRFVTAFMGFLDPDRHEVEYHSGGQGPILHFHAARGEFEWHKPTSFPLGIMALDAEPRAHRLTLEPGDILALVSDGIYEFAAADGSQFGEDGVARVIRHGHRMTMEKLSQRLVEAAFAFGGDVPQADDITLVLLRRLP